MPVMTTGDLCGCGKPATLLAWQGDTVPRIRLCEDCYPGDEEWFEGTDDLFPIHPAKRIK